MTAHGHTDINNHTLVPHSSHPHSQTVCPTWHDLRQEWRKGTPLQFYRMQSRAGPNIKNRWDRFKRLGLADAALLCAEALKQQGAPQVLCMDPRYHLKSENQSKSSTAPAIPCPFNQGCPAFPSFTAWGPIRILSEKCLPVIEKNKKRQNNTRLQQSS